MDGDDDILTREQVCHALRVSSRTLRRLIEERKFPNAIELSDGVWQWCRRDIRAYLYLKGRIGGTPPPRRRSRRRKRPPSPEAASGETTA